jgi:hypothetical protein
MSSATIKTLCLKNLTANKILFEFYHPVSGNMNMREVDSFSFDKSTCKVFEGTQEQCNFIVNQHLDYINFAGKNGGVKSQEVTLEFFYADDPLQAGLVREALDNLAKVGEENNQKAVKQNAQKLVDMVASVMPDAELTITEVSNNEGRFNVKAPIITKVKPNVSARAT